MIKSMGEVSMSSTGLLPSIASLFNNRLFSDVAFIFISDSREMQRIYCHKLILSLRSKVFASMFFDEKESSSEVRLPSSKANSFLQFLKFLYTDDVPQFYTFQDAVRLYELAAEYAVEELTEKCTNFILQESLTIENVFLKYECALSKNMPRLLKDCQNFVCSNTQLVLESLHLTQAPVEVVEDIVKLDNLSVSNELEVISAVLQWGAEELKRKQLSNDDKHLRKCINPLVKHIRFLTLSCEEFEYFIAKFEIFSNFESSLLTRKMYASQSHVHLPESLCPIDVKRGVKCGSESVSSVLLPKKALPNSSVNYSLDAPSKKVPSPLVQKSAPSDSSSKSVQSVFVQNNTSHDFLNEASSACFANALSKCSPSESASNFSVISPSGKTPSLLIKNSAPSDSSSKSVQSVFAEKNTSHDFNGAPSAALSKYSPPKSASNFSYISPPGKTPFHWTQEKAASDSSSKIMQSVFAGNNTSHDFNGAPSAALSKYSPPKSASNFSYISPPGKTQFPWTQEKAASDSSSTIMQAVFAEKNTSHDFNEVSSAFFANALSKYSPSESASYFSFMMSESKTEISNTPESPTSERSKISYRTKKLSPFNETKKSETASNQKFTSSPSIKDTAYFLRPNTYDNSRLRDFEFPLQESRPCFGTSFEKDVKCTASFKMKAGNIRLCGFELKVKNSAGNAIEGLDVDIDLSGFSKEPFNELFKEKIKNGVMSIQFPANMVLQAGHKGELEVSIDNLMLNRCCTCDNVNKGYEVNSGLNFSCQIALNSNQKTDNGFLFLISKLIYVPC